MPLSTYLGLSPTVQKVGICTICMLCHQKNQYDLKHVCPVNDGELSISRVLVGTGHVWCIRAASCPGSEAGSARLGARLY